MAVANYEGTYGHLPPAYLTDAEGRPAHSWRVLILPFLESNDIYTQYNFDEPWNGPNNRRLAESVPMPRTFAFHTGRHSEGTETNYLAVVGPETAWPGREGAPPDHFLDGRDSTILLVENLGAGIHWMEPRDLPFDEIPLVLGPTDGISGPYQDPAIVTVAGQVLRLDPDLPAATLRALLTANGGESLAHTSDRRWTLLPDGRDRPLARPPTAPADPSQPVGEAIPPNRSEDPPETPPICPND